MVYDIFSVSMTLSFGMWQKNYRMYLGLNNFESCSIRNTLCAWKFELGCQIILGTLCWILMYVLWYLPFGLGYKYLVVHVFLGLLHGWSSKFWCGPWNFMRTPWSGSIYSLALNNQFSDTKIRSTIQFTSILEMQILYKEYFVFYHDPEIWSSGLQIVRLDTKSWNKAVGIPLVNTSANWSDKEKKKRTLTCPSATFSRKNWIWISMCFVHWCRSRLRAR